MEEVFYMWLFYYLHFSARYKAEENVSKEGLRLSMPLQAACTQKLKLSTVVDILSSGQTAVARVVVVVAGRWCAAVEQWPAEADNGHNLARATLATTLPRQLPPASAGAGSCLSI